MKPFAKLALGLFVAGILLMAIGLFFSPQERASIQDQQSPTGQILPNPNDPQEVPRAQPAETAQPAGR